MLHLRRAFTRHELEGFAGKGAHATLEYDPDHSWYVIRVQAEHLSDLHRELLFLRAQIDRMLEEVHA